VGLQNVNENAFFDLFQVTGFRLQGNGRSHKGLYHKLINSSVEFLNVQVSDTTEVK